MRCRSRKGFTILELMVALVLSAGVLVAGRALFEQLAAVGDTIVVNAAVADSTRIRARLLREIVRNIETSDGGAARGFFGDARSAKFTSWCTGREVLRERCDITLTVDSVVTLSDSTGPIVAVRQTVPGVLRYLADSHEGGRWYRSWGPGSTLPLAIGIVFRSDTTVLRVGDRG